MFPLNWKLPFIKKTGERTTLGDALENAGSVYTLPTASAETKGGAKIGSGLKMTGETLSLDMPVASDTNLGGVKVGTGLSIEDGVLSASGGSGPEYRAGVQNSNIGAGAWNSFYVTFSSPMPDTNYAIFLDPVNFATDFKFSGLTKTVNGISGRIDNIGSESHIFTVYYLAIAPK